MATRRKVNKNGGTRKKYKSHNGGNGEDIPCGKNEKGELTKCPPNHRCEIIDGKPLCKPSVEIKLTDNDNNVTLIVPWKRHEKWLKYVQTLNNYINEIKSMRSNRELNRTKLSKDNKELIQKIENKELLQSISGANNSDELIIQNVLLKHFINAQSDNLDEDESKESIEESKDEKKSIEETKDEKEPIEESKDEEEPIEESKDEEEPIEESKDEEEPIENKLLELQNNMKVLSGDVDSKEYNASLNENEKLHHDFLKKNSKYDFLYPELDDPNFNVKIASRKEFFDTQYDGTIHDVKTQAEKMCNVKFELLPHQLFVKNFMSMQTPYNGLLLYHGLGTGKTCSAIGIAEEMRSYIKNIGSTHRIIVVASPNVQANFMTQLFDDRKLEQMGGVWNLNTCVGNELLKELNPLQLQNIPKDKVISQIKQVIKQYYRFMGYGEFANYIKRKTMVSDDLGLSASETIKQEIHNIREIFNNRLIIIDEVHNISAVQSSKQNKKTSAMLMHVCKYAENMRLLLLSATPMYNSYREIIWLTNLLNTIDKRALIREEDVFDKDGNFLEPRKTKDGRDLEGGRELLQRKLTGYISYVRGENPYTFPYRIYPDIFDESKLIRSNSYPTLQMNKKPIEKPLEHLPLYTNNMGEYQSRVYKFIMNHLRTKVFTTTLQGNERNMPTFDNMESFGYTLLTNPIQCLNIVYPNTDFDENQPVVEEKESEESSTMPTPQQIGSQVAEQLSSVTDRLFTGGDETPQVNEEDDVNIEENGSLIEVMVGSRGLSNIMTYKVTKSPHMLRHSFEYKPEVVEKYGRIFSGEHLGKYSDKINNICNIIKKSKGIVMIYSQYIDSGVVPMALALEEMGFSRFGTASYTKPLFTSPPTEPIDSMTMQSKSEYIATDRAFKPAKYVMITGDKFFSPNNSADLKTVTHTNNKYGENVKVILITKAAAEGLDFKNVRQLHVLEPWYNASRLEQIIGRTVRNLSHCALPFEERNVEIYLHATKTIENEEETADMYIYRYAENKALQIGRVTRLLKESAVDCILNIAQTNFSLESLTQQSAGQKIQLSLSSSQENKTIEYEVGDKPFTEICDYMDTCNYVCNPNAQIEEKDLYKHTYNEQFAKMNFSTIVKRIRELFREQTFYDRDSLIENITMQRHYPIEHIDYALSNIVENKSEHIVDKYGRYGYLINKDVYYVFQPFEITDEQASLYERDIPIDVKYEKLNMELPVEKHRVIDAAKPAKQEKSDNNVAIEQTIDNAFKQLADQLHYLKKEHEIQEQIKSKLKDISKINKRSLSQLRENIREDTKTENNIIKPLDWYKNAGIVYDVLKQKYSIPENTLYKIFVHHYLDTIDAASHILFIEQMYYDTKYEDSLKQQNKDEFELNIIQNVKLYYNKLKMEVTGKTAFVIPDASKTVLYIWNEENRHLHLAQPTDTIRFETQKQQQFTVPQSKINSIFGFMYPFKSDIMFKLKTSSGDKNNLGTICDKLGKIDILQRFMPIINDNPYQIKDWPEYKSKDFDSILKPGLCVLLECIMRYYNEATEEKVWFLDITRALVTNVVRL